MKKLILVLFSALFLGSCGIYSGQLSYYEPATDTSIRVRTGDSYYYPRGRRVSSFARNYYYEHGYLPPRRIPRSRRYYSRNRYRDNYCPPIRRRR